MYLVKDRSPGRYYFFLPGYIHGVSKPSIEDCFKSPLHPNNGYHKVGNKIYAHSRVDGDIIATFPDNTTYEQFKVLFPEHCL